MIVDASAIVAILQSEDDAAEFAIAIGSAESPKISAVTLFEATLRIERSGVRNATQRFDALIKRAGIEVIPFEAEHAAVARDARRTYGKGSGHPAKLNFGDCMTYATAYIAGEPLLYKGEDFKHTDLKSALD